MKPLSLHQLSLCREGRRLIAPLDLELHAGEVLAVAGPNGAGKSSLLKLAAGEWLPTGGQCFLAGRPIAHWSNRERAQRLAVLPQHSQLDFAFRVDEVVAMGRMPHASGQQRDAQLIREVMDCMQLRELAWRFYPQLSGGEKQRVQLARVLAQVWPEAGGACEAVLLLDEPTGNLDWSHQLELLHHLRHLATRGLAVLLVLHDLNQVLRFADRLALLDKGNLVALGAPEQVLSVESIRTLFGVEVQLQAHPRDGRPVIIQ